MSVSQDDLRFYAAANMPEDDASLVGGAVNLSTKVVFDDLSVNDSIDIVSDDENDTDQTYRIFGFDAAGSRIQEDFTANGLSVVVGSDVFERVNKIERQSGSALAGTITVKEHTSGDTIVTLESAANAGAGTEIQNVRKVFYAAASDPDEAKTLYEKIFVRNNNALTTLLDAVVSVMDAPVFSTPTATSVDSDSAKGQKVLNVDDTTGFTSGMSIIIGSGTDRKEAALIDSVSAGVSLTLTDNLKYAHTAAQADAVAKSRVTCDVEAPLDGTDTSANRLTEPTGYGYAFDCSDHPVANLQNHTAGSVEGIWLKLELDQGQAAFKDTVTIREWGATT